MQRNTNYVNHVTRAHEVSMSILLRTPKYIRTFTTPVNEVMSRNSTRESLLRLCNLNSRAVFLFTFIPSPYLLCHQIPSESITSGAVTILSAKLRSARLFPTSSSTSCLDRNLSSPKSIPVNKLALKHSTSGEHA